MTPDPGRTRCTPRVSIAVIHTGAGAASGGSAPGQRPGPRDPGASETVRYVSGYVASWVSMVRRRAAACSVALDQWVVWPAWPRVMSRTVAILVRASEL